jgi:hypothetical protein
LLLYLCYYHYFLLPVTLSRITDPCTRNFRRSHFVKNLLRERLWLVLWKDGLLNEMCSVYLTVSQRYDGLMILHISAVKCMK